MNLPANHVAFLDAYAEANHIESRSAVLHIALRLLRTSELGAAYEEAWQEWTESGMANDWDVASGDGLPDLPL